MKKVIEACIERILEFETQEEAANYLEGLRAKNSDFRVVSRGEIEGKYRLRIQEQYNKSPMIGE